MTKKDGLYRPFLLIFVCCFVGFEDFKKNLQQIFSLFEFTGNEGFYRGDKTYSVVESIGYRTPPRYIKFFGKYPYFIVLNFDKRQSCALCHVANQGNINEILANIIVLYLSYEIKIATENSYASENIHHHYSSVNPSILMHIFQ